MPFSCGRPYPVARSSRTWATRTRTELQPRSTLCWLAVRSRSPMTRLSASAASGYRRRNPSKSALLMMFSWAGPQVATVAERGLESIAPSSPTMSPDTRMASSDSRPLPARPMTLATADRSKTTCVDCSPSRMMTRGDAYSTAVPMPRRAVRVDAGRRPSRLPAGHSGFVQAARADGVPVVIAAVPTRSAIRFSRAG
jgi:hypothetical protein